MNRDYITVDVVIAYGPTIIAERVKFYNTQGQGYTEAQVPGAVRDGLSKLGARFNDMFAARFPQATTKSE